VSLFSSTPSARYKKQVAQLEADREDIGQRLDALGQQRKQLQQAEDTAQITLNQLELEKDALYRQVLRHQRSVKRFQSLESGR
jgi:chromosome segregation ATPase